MGIIMCKVDGGNSGYEGVVDESNGLAGLGRQRQKADRSLRLKTALLPSPVPECMGPGAPSVRLGATDEIEAAHPLKAGHAETLPNSSNVCNLFASMQ